MGPLEDIVSNFSHLSQWRRDLHANPELLYDVHRTAAFVADQLRSFGVDDVVTGIGKTGVVGVLKGRVDTSSSVIGLRADMDALPIREATGKPWASRTDGKMHACGHDGHTAMLLGAAEWLSRNRSFDGTVVFIFQPAEEGGAGGKAMVDDGLMDRFDIQRVFGLHNLPGLPVGQFAIRSGPIMAAADHFGIALEGKGGHAALPHTTIDTTLVAAQLITSLQSLVSRNVDPVESAVLSVTSMITDTDAYNVIPQKAALKGTVRTLSESVRQDMRTRLASMVETLPTAFGAKGKLSYIPGYPVTVNNAEQTAFAAEIAGEVALSGKVDETCPPMMGAEDFSFMLNERPGAFIFMGNGDSASLHHPEYDFNDDAIPYGVSYWIRLAERALPLSN